MDIQHVDDLIGMYYFVQVARHGSLSRASEALGVPISSLSRRVCGYEKTLGVQLLHRTTRLCRLTPAGEDFLAHCAPLVDGAARAHEDLLQRDAPMSGRIRIATTSEYAAWANARALAQIRRLHPDLELVVESVPDIQVFFQQSFDLALDAGCDAPSGCIRRVIECTPCRLVASRSYAVGITAALDLPQCTWIGVRAEITQALEHLPGLRIARPAILEISGALSALALVKEDAGLAILPEPLVQRGVRQGQLVDLSHFVTLTPMSVSVLFKSRLLSARCRALIEYLTSSQSAHDSEERPTVPRLHVA